jgi:transposase-like protein
MTFDVYASTISNKHIKFKCPFCYSKYKKNGEPYKRSKRIFHTHGSNNDLTNRTEHRLAHCYGNKEYATDFNIHIDNNTTRV